MSWTDSASSPGSASTGSRKRLCQELRERIERGEYWVDLDFLTCLLVDSGAVSPFRSPPPPSESPTD